MKTIRTIKCKVVASEHFDAAVVKYLAAACWVSEQVFESKELNSNRLSRELYGKVRKKFGIPSQLTCSLFRQVTATYKTQKALGKWSLATFKRPTLPLTHKRDFGRNRKGLTILGEPAILEHKAIPTTGWKDSKLKRVGKTWFLILAHEVEVPEPKSEGCIVGVDFGIKRLMVATNSANADTFFFKGGVLNHRRTCIRRARAAIQAVGSRSAHRLLRRMSGNEAAVTNDLLHCASKSLIGYAVSNGARRVVLEDLSNVRDSSLNKGKDLRSKIHRWPYANGQFKIAYKAQACGIATEFVNPANTSRGCAKCGHVSASNRKGLSFCCQKCDHQDDADRNASVNIRLRSIVAAQVGVTMRSLQPLKSSEPLDIVAGLSVTHGSLVSV